MMEKWTLPGSVLSMVSYAGRPGPVPLPGFWFAQEPN